MRLGGYSRTDVVWKTSSGGTIDWWGAFPATRNAVPITGQYVENPIANYRELTISLRTRAVLASLSLLHRLAPFESTVNQSRTMNLPSYGHVMLGAPFPAFIDGSSVARGELAISDACSHGAVSMSKTEQAMLFVPAPLYHSFITEYSLMKIFLPSYNPSIIHHFDQSKQQH